MKLKQNLLLTITTLLLIMSANSHAGREGVSFYYGVALGAVAPEDYDVVPTGNFMLGFEEDGWALEGIVFGSTEAESNVANVDYSINGSDIGIAYRTIEENNNWFKFKVSRVKMTFDATVETEESDTAFTLGWGMRPGLDSRFEIDYSYYSPEDTTIHMLNFRYFWGGAKYEGRGL